MTEYTIMAVAGVIAVVAIELFWLRTGIFATATFWISYGIIVFFQCLVDGWLTKLSAPIVIYDGHELTGWRAPFDIPVEDFLFGFAMVTLAIMLWEWAGPQGRRRRGHAIDAASAPEGTTPTHPR